MTFCDLIDHFLLNTDVEVRRSGSSLQNVDDIQDRITAAVASAIEVLTSSLAEVYPAAGFEVSSSVDYASADDEFEIEVYVQVLGDLPYQYAALLLEMGFVFKAEELAYHVFLSINVGELERLLK